MSEELRGKITAVSKSVDISVDARRSLDSSRFTSVVKAVRSHQGRSYFLAPFNETTATRPQLPCHGSEKCHHESRGNTQPREN